LLKRHRPGFSTLFLNAGAHIQHHYFFNASKAFQGPQKNPAWYIRPGVDPFAEMLQVYDVIVGNYVSDSSRNLIIATGLTQVPYDRVKYYWRLKDHDRFLRGIGLCYKRVQPRMTRDFLVEFDNAEDAASAQRQLQAIRAVTDGELLFSEVENRGDSLFVTLTYPHDIPAGFKAVLDGREIALGDEVVFVAIKNGMHHAKGFAYFQGEVRSVAPKPDAHVSSLFKTVLDFFGVDPAAGTRQAESSHSS
jgi:hypothetical protein